MMFLWLLPIIAIVGLDQLTKYLVAVSPKFPFEEPVTIIDRVLDFHYIHNDGAALGILDDHRWVFMVTSTVAIVAVILFMFVKYKQYYHPFLYTALSFIAGGGIGNMIDRIALGKVIDFIDFQPLLPFWKWIFNVADMFVCVGCAMVILYIVVSDIKEAKKKKADGESE